VHLRVQTRPPGRKGSWLAFGRFGARRRGSSGSSSTRGELDNNLTGGLGNDRLFGARHSTVSEADSAISHRCW
jgi:hypothetical protein